MRVYIHIGMTKTGSTALQKMLSENETALTNHGLIYAKTGRRRFNHFYILKQFRDYAPATLLHQALSETKTGQTLLLSCEGFWRLNEKQLNNFESELNGYDVTAYIYLRNPRKFLASLYRQGIKGPHAQSHSAKSFISKFSDQLDYSNLLQIWSRKFNLVVRVYDTLATGIEYDFLEAIGRRDIDVKLARSIENRTPCDGALRVMRLANWIFPPEQSRFIRRKIIKHESKFSLITNINNSVFSKCAQEVVAEWNDQYLLKYISTAELKALKA